MEISCMDAFTIRNKKVRVEVGGPSKDNGKYMGWIMLDVDRWHPIVNTNAVFDTPEDAKKYMQDLVDDLKSCPIEELLPSEDDEDAKFTREMLILLST